jgi:hypothetical protein
MWEWAATRLESERRVRDSAMVVMFYIPQISTFCQRKLMVFIQLPFSTRKGSKLRSVRSDRLVMVTAGVVVVQIAQQRNVTFCKAYLLATN